MTYSLTFPNIHVSIANGFFYRARERFFFSKILSKNASSSYQENQIERIKLSNPKRKLEQAVDIFKK